MQGIHSRSLRLLLLYFPHPPPLPTREAGWREKNKHALVTGDCEDIAKLFSNDDTKV